MSGGLGRRADCGGLLRPRLTCKDRERAFTDGCRRRGEGRADVFGEDAEPNIHEVERASRRMATNTYAARLHGEIHGRLGTRWPS